ncbi:hypothetical protein BJV78DRAFT_155669 [Lactifluus subvellereus]|nr:hypothetical protein BJV78DRAFT_155669 [Lactifluus subvellereus]
MTSYVGCWRRRMVHMVSQHMLSLLISVAIMTLNFWHSTHRGLVVNEAAKSGFYIHNHGATWDEMTTASWTKNIVEVYEKDKEHLSVEKA